MGEGWGSALGRATKFLTPWLDPRQRTLRKIDALEREKKRLLEGTWNENAAARVAALDNQLVSLRRTLERGQD